MKFTKGLIIGTLLGVTIGTALSEQQRRQIVQRVKKQVEPVGRAASDNLGNVADIVTDHAADAVDKAGSAVASSLESDGVTVSTG